MQTDWPFGAIALWLGQRTTDQLTAAEPTPHAVAEGDVVVARRSSAVSTWCVEIV